MASVSGSSPSVVSATDYGATSMMDDLPKFSPGAGAILTCAQEEAAKRDRPYVGSEHFLLALMLNPSTRIYDYIGSKLQEKNTNKSSSTQWSDRIISLLDNPHLCGTLNDTACSSSSTHKMSKGSGGRGDGGLIDSHREEGKHDYPPFSSSMLEVFEIVKQISSVPVQDGDRIISDGLVTSEFLVAGIMLHGVNMAAEVLSRASKGVINSWTILDAINVNPNELHVNRSGIRKSSSFTKGAIISDRVGRDESKKSGGGSCSSAEGKEREEETSLMGPAGIFTPGGESLPSLTDLKNKSPPTSNSNWLIPGRLIIGSKPDELEARKLSEAGVTTFVSLIGEHSFKDYQSGSRVKYPRGVERGHFVHFPIADFEVPPQDDLVAFVLELKQRIVAGECLFVHCRGGHGRTGTVVIPLIAALFDVSNMVATELVNEFTLSTRQSDVYYAQQGWEVEMPETDEQRRLTSKVNDAVRLKVPRRR